MLIKELLALETASLSCKPRWEMPLPMSDGWSRGLVTLSHHVSWMYSSPGEKGSGGPHFSTVRFLPDDDSWDLVTCFCMKPFAGRPMIECNECHTWIHLSCAKIRKSNVPEVFVCQKCRDSKFDIRRSNRSRMGSRKLFLD